MTPLPSHSRFEQSVDDPLECPLLTTPPSLELSIIVPAYNEQARLPSMLNETLTYLTFRTTQNASFTWEVIVVDDGSRDATAATARRFAVERGERDRVRVVRLERNCGKGGAVRAGMLLARGRYMLMADADAATVFEEVERLEEAMAGGGVDVAVGSRVHLRGKGVKEGRGWLRGFLSMVFSWVVVYIGGVVALGDTQCGFKLYSREAARVAFVGQRLRRWAFDVENLYRVQKVGMTVVEVPVRWTEVPGSKLSVVRATLNMILDMVKMRYMYVTGRWRVDVEEGPMEGKGD